MLARVIELLGPAFFQIMTAICFWMLSRSFRRLREDYREDRVVFLYLDSIKARMNDLEKEIEDRWRWSQHQPEARAKRGRKKKNDPT